MAVPKTHKRKKNSRQRGSWTHGWGAKKKHRGAGNRGGRGNAGTGKRGDAKKPCIWKNTKYFGKYGFKKKGVIKKIRPVNIKFLEENLPELIAKNFAEEKAGVYEIDLIKLGYNKLMGNGRVTKKFRITAPIASKKVVEKVKKAGGAIILPAKKEEVKASE